MPFFKTGTRRFRSTLSFTTKRKPVVTNMHFKNENPLGLYGIKIKMFICFGCWVAESVSSLSGDLPDVLTRDLYTNKPTHYLSTLAIILSKPLTTIKIILEDVSISYLAVTQQAILAFMVKGLYPNTDCEVYQGGYPTSPKRYSPLNGGMWNC